MGNLRKRVGLLFFLAVAVLYIIIYVVPRVTGFFTATYTAEYGELKTYDDTDMYIVRDETVYTSEVSGTANRLIDEGRLIRGNTKVMEVSGNQENSDSERYEAVLDRLGNAAVPTSGFTSEEGGVVSYFADGYEAELTPETMGEKTRDYYLGLSQESVTKLSDGAVSAGDPVYKIIDKSKWYATAFVPADSAERYKEGSSVDVEIGDGIITMTVTGVSEEGDYCRLAFETTRYYEKYGATRVAAVRIVTSDAAGLIIDNGSIVEKDGVKGVYVKNKKDRYDFTPINILITDGTSSVISDSFYYDSEGTRTSTVNPHDDVLKDPDSI